MATLSRSNSTMELDYTLDHNVTSPSDIDLAPDILQTLLEADEFVTKYDLADIREVIRKGALLFHHPDDLKRIEEETLYLGNGNIQGKPPGSRVSQGVCHAAGFLSALLAVLPPQIFDPHPDDDWSYHRGSEGLWFWEYPKTFWEAVLLSSIAPLISAVLGFWLSLILNRYGGRRRGFSMGAVLALVAIFGQFISQDWHLHLVVDVLCVTALTILTCTIFLYIIEISETSRRASAFARWYSWNILFGVFAQLITANYVGPLTIIFSAIAASLILGLSIKMPESPYWLAMNGKVQAAYESLRSFRETEVIAARDLYQIYITDEQNDLRNGNLTWPKPFSRPSELFTNNRLRVIVIANIAFMITRVFSLTQHLSVFAPDMSSTFNLYATSVRNILSCCAPVLLTFLVDRLARRHMLISLLCGMFVLMLAQLLTSNQVVNLISKSCFFIIFSVGELAFSIYIVEIFPLYHRETGVALTSSLLFACFGIFRFIASARWTLRINSSGLDVLISLLISIPIAYLFVKETRKVPLESIGSALEPFPHGLISYRVYVHLPYLFGRYVLRRQIELVPFEEHEYSGGGITLNSENAFSA